MTLAEKPLNTRKSTSEEMRIQRDKDHKNVKGIFRCFEPRGGSFTFNFKQYRGDPVLKYTMVDGETYEIPLMVAKHLNKNCWYPRHTHVLDAEGNPTVSQGQKVKRCSFESLEFVMDE